MKKRKNKFSIKSRHLIIIMTILCIGMIALVATSRFSFEPVKQGAGYVISPFQNGINSVGQWMRGQTTGFRSAKKLEKENTKLEKKISTLTEKNNTLLQDQDELERLRSLYELDESFAEYEKIAAQVISKDPGNWYSTFTINRGSDSGIQVDCNVIAPDGLVGIITQVGKDWATVRSIIDDSSDVSAMAASTSDRCMVTGNLLKMEEGKLDFIQMTDKEDKVQAGERIVTSNISDRYLKGILIGHVSEIGYDANKLTKSGTITPAVDFEHLHEVLVIKELKQKGSD